MRYRHRDSSLGDSVAWCLPEDLYALGRSKKFNSRVDAKQCVLNVQNRLRGIHARRGDGTFGEIIPHAIAEDGTGFVVARGPIATVEIGTEVKILAKAMSLKRSNCLSVDAPKVWPGFMWEQAIHLVLVSIKSKG